MTSRVRNNGLVLAEGRCSAQGVMAARGRVCTASRSYRSDVYQTDIYLSTLSWARIPAERSLAQLGARPHRARSMRGHVSHDVGARWAQSRADSRRLDVLMNM
jgi:hypothetical protein